MNAKLGGWATTLALTLVLTACATTRVRDNFDAAQQTVDGRLGTKVDWLTTDDARKKAQSDVDALLATPLGAEDAVRIALTYAPAVQALLFDAAARSSAITQQARLPNPVFGFERLLRPEPGVRELEITRMLALSIYDLVLLPARLELAGVKQQGIHLQLAGDIVHAAVAARLAWVRAVASEQALGYARQVKASADASAELARRMQAVGNFSRLQRAREQTFSAEAVAQLARAEQHARTNREALVRSLGLTEAQAGRLTLPDRLPDLPSAPQDERLVLQSALEQRLDVQIAQVQLAAFAREQGLSWVTGNINGLSIAGVYRSETGRQAQRGYDLEIPLPLFDLGDAKRLRAESAYMAALNRITQRIADAGSQVREVYAEYRTAYDLARHYRDEILPLRKAISDENLLRYNAMLIGVFELLADAREQIASTVQAIDAQRDFWLADAALQSVMIGAPSLRDAAASTAVDAGLTD